MGSRQGYEYLCRFSILNLDEIPSFRSLVDKWKPEPGIRPFLFHINTNFIVKKQQKQSTDKEEEADDDAAAILIDSESLKASFFARGNEKKDIMTLLVLLRPRLREYWMTGDEMMKFAKEAHAFAKQIDIPSLEAVPVAVALDVCTVQQHGESLKTAMDRAITAQRLLPLYLWPRRMSVTEATELHKPMTERLIHFLWAMHRARVEDVDEGLALMPVCYICGQKPTLGAQISSLANCSHTFHSRCIVGLLEDNNLCPVCRVPAYDAYIAQPPENLRMPLPPPYSGSRV